MTNRLLVAIAALSLVLACTPARQVAEQQQTPTTPLRVRTSEPVATAPVSTPKPAALETPSAADETSDSPKPDQAAPSLAPLVHSKPSTPSQSIEEPAEEALPSWVKEAAATVASPAEVPVKTEAPVARTQQPDSVNQENDLVTLMEQMIAEMEAGQPDSPDTVHQSLTAPYPGQVQQIGSVTIEYRESAEPEAVVAAPAKSTASRADEIMRRIYRQQAAQQVQEPASNQPESARLEVAPAPDQGEALASLPEKGGVGITFMRAGTDSTVKIITRPEVTETASSELELYLPNGHRVSLDETRLLEWETAVIIRRQGLTPRTSLPTWLLQGLEWLTDAPTTEPQRSLTLMPLYRHMDAAGYLSEYNVNRMSDEQVIAALRNLVDEAKSKKKLRGEVQPRPIDTETHIQPTLAQPLPVDQALSLPKTPNKPGTRTAVSKRQRPGQPVPAFTELTEVPVFTMRRGKVQSLALEASLGTDMQVAFAPTDAKRNRRRQQRKEYIRKLTRVSLRAGYGFSSYRSSMSYELPNLEATVADAANALKSQYPWVPWGQVDVPVGTPVRTRELNKNGQFYLSAGLNLPLGFVEVETGPGRFSQSAFSLSDFMPPWQGLDMQRTSELMMQRATAPEAKTAITIRVGSELERLLPDHLLPRFRIGKMYAGLDVSGYYLSSTDLSYRVGVEILDPNAVAHLEDLFSPVPLISNNAKQAAATAIVSHVESSLPTYFWLPALKGYGLGAKAYVNLNPRLRFAARYHYEQTRGITLESTDWMPRGPVVKTTFLSFGLETQI